jgi:hypothetical protein
MEWKSKNLFLDHLTSILSANNLWLCLILSYLKGKKEYVKGGKRTNVGEVVRKVKLGQVYLVEGKGMC